MEKIKIAHIITRMDWAGAPDIVRILCEQSDSKRYSITFIVGPTTYATEKTKKFFEDYRSNIVEISCLKRKIHLFNDMRAFIALYRLFREKKFDIVHAHTMKAGFLGRIAALCARIPHIVYMPHGHVFYGYFNVIMNKMIVLLEKIAVRCTSIMIALTELEKQDFQKLHIIPSGGMVVVPSGLEIDALLETKKEPKDVIKASMGIPPNVFLVGMCSRLEPIKGPSYFIQAAALVIQKCPHVHFVIVGDGSLRRELENTVTHLGMNKHITFLGWRDDCLPIVSLLDILVQPSLNEAVGRVLLEAQALGVPVIGTAVGGVPEIVQQGISGLLVPPKNAEQLATMITYLFENEQERKKLSAQAQKWVFDTFSSHKMVEAVEQVYERLLS